MKELSIAACGSVLHVFDPEGQTLYFKSRHTSCFIVTLSGAISFRFADRELIADAQHAIFIPAGADYVNHCLADAESYVVNFDTVSPIAAARQVTPVSRGRLEELHDCVRQHGDDGPAGRLYAQGMLCLLACELLKTEASLSPAAALAAQAERYLQEHYADTGSPIAAAARHCHVSPAYLRRVYAAQKGCSPSQALTRIRMAQAHAMVLEKRPVKEIAFAVGYSDIYQFSRAYKRCFGCAPSKTEALSRPLPRP